MRVDVDLSIFDTAIFRARGDEAEALRILADHGERSGGTDFVVPLEAAYAAAVRLRREGHDVLAAPGAQARIKDRAYRCDDGRLRDYQRKGVEFLRTRRRALLADEMGTGKTAQTLVAQDKNIGLLVVCPPVVVGTWVDEVGKWRRDLRPLVWRPPYPIFPDPGEVVVLPYSRLPSELVARTRWIVREQGEDAWTVDLGKFEIPRWLGPKPTKFFDLALDEAHFVKTATSKRTTVVRALSSMARRTVLLTGTPLLNAPPELWALMQAARAGRDVFGGWDEFVKMFGGTRKHLPHCRRSDCTGCGYGGYDWGTPTDDARRRLAGFMLRRTQEEVLEELPPFTFQEVRVELPKRARVLGESNVFKLSDDEVLAECEPQGILSAARAELARMKIDTMKEIVEEHEAAGELLVVFSHHRAPIEALSARAGWAVILGDTPDSERTRIVRDFQAGKYKGIGGTIGAMGVGVTLTRAHRVLFVDRSYVPAENRQARFRVKRIGQEASAIFVTDLVADHPVDRRVCEVLARKEEMLEGAGLA